MKIIFYSYHCEYCIKMINYIKKNNISSLFKLINIDENNYPKSIDIIPTLIDTELNQPLKGKSVFEYLLNIQYFNNPTNNIKYNIPINPIIKEDDKASYKNLNEEIANSSIENINFIKKQPSIKKKINYYLINHKK